MKYAPLTLILALAATPAFAKDHSGHDPHAGHTMPEQADQPQAEDKPIVDPHAGHKLDSAPEPTPMGQDMDHSAHQGMDHSNMDHGSMNDKMIHGPAIPVTPPPPEASSGPAHAADSYYPNADMASVRTAMAKEMSEMNVATFRIDRLELQTGKGHDTWVWEGDFSYGGDIDKLWLKSEGHGQTSGGIEEAEVQALYSHAIGPWFDVQAGVRQQFGQGPDRTQLALGIQGLAPYFLEIDSAAFLSTKGEVTARIEAEYDQRLTQRLILQPRLEMGLSAQKIPELGLGSGFTSLEAGARLRYEIIREFAPYIGVEWQRDLGTTADFTRANGEDPDRVAFLAGVKFWF